MEPTDNAELAVEAGPRKENTMKSATIIAIAGALLLSAPVVHAQEVRGREANQQGRIAQGIGSGQITAGGARNLERREGNLNAQRRADLAANGGHLTGHEYRNLNRRENRLSRSIYRDKHNDIAQPGVVPAGR